MDGQRRTTPLLAKTVSMLDSEGFSDASSGYVSAFDHADSDDGRRPLKAPQDPQIAPHMALMQGSYPGLSPMIIMNNFVLKQPNSMAPTLQPWSFPSSLETVNQSPVVLLQPVGTGSSGVSQNRPIVKHRRSKKFLPILKSFPRIAPHPSSNSSSSTELRNTGSPHGDRRRRSHRSDRLPNSPVSTNHLPQLDLEAETENSQNGSQYDFQMVKTIDCQNSLSRPTSPPKRSQPHPATVMFSMNSDCSPGLSAPGILASSSSQAECMENVPESLSPCQSKRKRFSNTYNILNRSGLLGITLRTKELIRQNQRSQAQLLQLQAQTDLFAEAVSSGDPLIWSKLQVMLQEAKEVEEDCLGQENWFQSTDVAGLAQNDAGRLASH
ncbi:CLOCK-interacting pacemaker a [Denticeps clupeoides]|uniref:CLOCK-interacting pacemaker n=1 Tax=Denticeps clupeoides TaxID=299321 RepID=A0AAY4A9M0_9TELE|nr:CLOCK-interacting pacemaker [Denticeps clupeoides]